MIIVGAACMIPSSDSPEDIPFGVELSEQFLNGLKQACGIEFSPEQLPQIARLDEATIDSLSAQVDAFNREYQLWRSLGFIETPRPQFVQHRVGELQSLAGFYEPGQNIVWLRQDELSVAMKLVLAHELTHAWRILNGFADTQAIRDEWSRPEASIAFRAGEEGIAIACTRSYFSQLSDEDRWAWHERLEQNDSSAVDAHPILEPFFGRAHGWVNVLGPEVIESHPRPLHELVRVPTLIGSTATLLGKPAAAAQTHIDLGPLILREALVWSGVPWQNAEAIALGVIEDELRWQTQQGDADCLRVAIRYVEPKLATGRYLTAREAFERWSRFLDATVLETRDGFFVMDSCIPEP